MIQFLRAQMHTHTYMHKSDFRKFCYDAGNEMFYN